MNRLALIDENVLAYKYLSEKKPIRVVANEMGVAVGTVYNHLQKLGIETRKITDYPVTEKQREAWRKIGQKRKGEKMSEAAKKKISEARRRIVELLGENLPKIELFARQKAAGWDCWGNEV